MRIALLTIGTRGDIQPYIALGKALRDRGHQVILGAPENFGEWISDHGLEFRSLGIDMESFAQSPEGRKALSGSPLAMVKLWRETILPSVRYSNQASWEAAQEAEVIVYHPKTTCAEDIAEATGAALVHSAPFPIFPSPDFPFCIIPGSYGPWLNRLSYKVMNMNRVLFHGLINRWREETLGLDRVKRWAGRPKEQPKVMICAASPALVEYRPVEESGVEMTGYWFLDEGLDWEPDKDLARFLAAGPEPVYIGFGSMPGKDPEKLSRRILEGVGLAGVRAIVATGWGGLIETEVPESVHLIKAAPHDKLFKLVRAVVHHGGAGTTAAGLRAGRPTLICPSAFDQPYWGRRVHALGLGPKPQSLKRIKAARFAQRLKDLVTNESYQSKAGELARIIAKEDGLGRTVEIIESLERKQ